MKHKIYGITVKSESFYVIRDKQDHQYADGDGGKEYSMQDAYWFRTYKDATEELAKMDDPMEWDIIRMNCTTTLEEIMGE